jgi:hypothetical protein
MQKENSTEDTSIEMSKPEYWQWIKGDLIGDVVTFKDTDDSYINFNEGGRIAIALRDEFLQSLDPDIAGEFIKPILTNDPLNSSIKSVQNGTPKTQIEPPPSVVKSPIRILFDKQKKNNKIKLILEFPVNIPQPEMYELMSTSFDIDEVNSELTDFILDQLSTTDITECLNQSIKSLIESKYKSE